MLERLKTATFKGNCINANTRCKFEKGNFVSHVKCRWQNAKENKRLTLLKPVNMHFIGFLLLLLQIITALHWNAWCCDGCRFVCDANADSVRVHNFYTFSNLLITLAIIVIIAVCVCFFFFFSLNFILI